MTKISAIKDINDSQYLKETKLKVVNNGKCEKSNSELIENTLCTERENGRGVCGVSLWLILNQYSHLILI